MTITRAQKIDWPEALTKYKEGLTLSEVAKIYACDRTAVWYQLRKAGIARRTPYTRRWETVRCDAFDAVTHESVYWLGFFLADGCISDPESQKSFMISIALAERDEKHLRAFASFLGASSRVRRDPSNAAVMLRFGNPFIWRRLHKLGVRYRKSTLGFSWPSDLGQDLTRTMLRGYFDGDGCLSRGIAGPSVRVLGPSGFLAFFLAQFRAYSGRGPCGYLHARGAVAYELGFCGRKIAAEVCHFLYETPGPALLRKRARAKAIIEGLVAPTNPETSVDEAPPPVPP
jgi:hypothetical protein